MKDKILDFIKDNKFSTSDVADALGRKGELKDIKLISGNKYVVGEISAVYACKGSNYVTHKMLKGLEPNKIVYIENVQCEEVSLIGGLICKYIFDYKAGLAVVCNGNVRDVHDLMKYPVWCKGFSPIVCDKVPIYLDKFESELDGGIMVCDICGCVAIRPEELTEELYQSLEHIKHREIGWFVALERGFSTFEITCEANDPSLWS